MNKKSIFILNTCDTWHNWASMDPIGAYTSQGKAIAAAKRHSKGSVDGKLTSDDIDDLNRIEQTQQRDENYLIQQLEINSKTP